MTARAAATPRATMRLQLHAQFTFADAQARIPYMKALGISHVYASPILTARAGSRHGYDVVDPTTVNPELGGEDGLRRLVEALRAAQMGLIVDIVPNHMAVGGGDNRYWLDVLAWGRDSRHAAFFDIDWEPADAALQGKLLAPFLGVPYGEALEAGDIVLAVDPVHGFIARYFDDVFPIDPRCYRDILSASPRTAPWAGKFDGVTAGDFGARLAGLFAAAGGPAALDAATATFDARGDEGRARLHDLLERQNFRLAWWRTSGDEINWRRFFDVTTLAALRADRPEVFEQTHATILRLYGQGLLDGLRVDHVDGLSDPGGYCRLLRARLREKEGSRPPDAPDGPAYLVVEKILAAGEALDPSWEMDGTTGYDFMNDVSALLHDPAGEAPLSEGWHELTGRPPDFESEEIAARREILDRSFSRQLEAAADALYKLAQTNLIDRDRPRDALRRCLIEVLAHCPAYRTYAGAEGRTALDGWVLDKALAGARQTALPADRVHLDALESWLGEAGQDAREETLDLKRDAIRRFEQLSAPLAAKAVEDTAFYRYGRLLSRTDVGFDPARFAMTVDAFHGACAERAVHLPRAMLATATHDHKRGEDIRARLAVLSEMPADWLYSVRGWLEGNAGLKRDIEGIAAPSVADEVVLYQTIVAAWPLDLAPDDAAGLAVFAERLCGWQEKAIREAKLRSGWDAPDEDYEAAARTFLLAILTGEDDRARRRLAEFARRIAPAGALNGLTQLVLKLTVPGVPDLYQGTDGWDLSLVDPDNRRPVDYPAREADMRRHRAPAEALPHWRDGAVKQAVIRSLLALRAERPALFAAGAYLPLALEGVHCQRALAFARILRDEMVIVVAPRLCAELVSDLPLVPAQAWQDTRIVVPEQWGGRFEDYFTKRELAVGTRASLNDLLGQMPVAILVARAVGTRSVE